jgi:hypothetical protein
MLQVPKFTDYAVEKVALAPRVPADTAKRIESVGWMVEDIAMLVGGLS